MKLKLYQVDAFTDRVFGGNPAAVCPLDEWISDDLMQKIAMENNLAETAFIVKNEKKIDIRWFTPTVEVDLCGHATLAAAHVLFEYEGHKGNSIQFFSHRSGDLPVVKNGDVLTLNFPADKIQPAEMFEEFSSGLNATPKECYRGKTDYMLVFENEEAIKNLEPDFRVLSKIDARGVIVTAAGDEVDFVSRFFAPQSGVDEDPVTGSAHTTLTRYWAQRLQKTGFTAKQLSKRGGLLQCKLANGRVEISGKAVLYFSGGIFID